ncbi:MAG: hypothetical protein HYT12_00270 [Candidatus Liptonbacteria bacterium]|nr:hypothetical protein [Candidatus Liptonbacteria bacterium]
MHDERNEEGHTYEHYAENLAKFLHPFIKEDVFKKLYRFFKKHKLNDGEFREAISFFALYTGGVVDFLADAIRTELKGGKPSGAQIKKLSDAFIRRYSRILALAWAEALFLAFQDINLIDIVYLDEVMLPDKILFDERRSFAESTLAQYGVNPNAVLPILFKARVALQSGELIPTSLVRMIAMRGITVCKSAGH